MLTELINYIFEIGALVAALALSGVCLVGLVVWLSGSSARKPRQAK